MPANLGRVTAEIHRNSSATVFGIGYIILPKFRWITLNIGEFGSMLSCSSRLNGGSIRDLAPRNAKRGGLLASNPIEILFF